MAVIYSSLCSQRLHFLSAPALVCATARCRSSLRRRPTTPVCGRPPISLASPASRCLVGRPVSPPALAAPALSASCRLARRPASSASRRLARRPASPPASAAPAAGLRLRRLSHWTPLPRRPRVVLPRRSRGLDSHTGRPYLVGFASPRRPASPPKPGTPALSA